MINKYFLVGIGVLTIIKIFAIFLTDFSFFGDEAQYWLWSKKLDLGYFSKPPLIAWIIASYSWLFGDSFESLKTLPILFYFMTGIAVYKLCLKLGLEKGPSIICSLSFLVMPAVSVSSFLISTDVVLLFFWTLSLISLINIKKNPSSINFIICGLMVGLALLAKYAAIYFFVSLISLYVFDKSFRGLFLSNILKFLLLFLIVFVVILPNVVWNINNGWLTLQHTAANANFENSNVSLVRGGGFLLVQIIMIGVLLFLGAIHNFKKIKLDAENIFLLSFSLPIILIVFFESVFVRANANWAAVGLVCLFIFFIRPLLASINFYVIGNFVVNFVFAIIFYLLVAASYNNNVFDRISGVNVFSQEIKNYLVAAGNVVVSDRLLYSNLAYELKDEKISFFMPHVPGSKITNHFQISSALKKGVLDNFILIGAPTDIKYLGPANNIKLIKEASVKFTNIQIRVYEVSF